MSHFNLIDEKWIPVRFTDGRRAELGIRDTFLRSKEIAVVEDGSPLVVAALYRFLLAVLYRAVEGPTDIDQAKALFKSGFPAGKIEAYLTKWRNRFWLFDEKYPFGQVVDYIPKEWRSWTVLSTECNDDNSKVLFDHVDVRAPGSISEASSARWLLATQTFSIGKGKSPLGYTSSAPSATGVMVIPLGRNLEDTLLFSLVPQGRFTSDGDKPIWEREAENIGYLKDGPERDITGLADLYSWRARSILLERDPSGGVSRLAFASGVKPRRSPDQTDPMLAYRIHEKFGILPIQFQERGLWRDFDSLLPDESTRLAPKVIENAAILTRLDRSRFPTSMMVLGQANDQAKIEFWRMERFNLPGALAGDKAIRFDIRRFLELAETNQKFLWSAAARFAQDMLSHGDHRKPTKKDISEFVRQMPCMPMYWSVLEAKFHEILQSFTLEANPDLIELEWRQAVCNALDEAWKEHRISVSMGDAWTIRALVKAEGKIQSSLKKLYAETADFSQRLEKEGV